MEIVKSLFDVQVATEMMIIICLLSFLFLLFVLYKKRQKGKELESFVRYGMWRGLP